MPVPPPLPNLLNPSSNGWKTRCKRWTSRTASSSRPFTSATRRKSKLPSPAARPRRPSNQGWRACGPNCAPCSSGKLAMKTEKREATGRLLNDLLADELEGLGDGRKAIALAAFRRAHLVRRVRNSAGLVVVLAALAAALFHYSRPRQTQLIAETAPAATAPIPAGTAYSGDTLVKISDAELIASFPADTCFLAEV